MQKVAMYCALIAFGAVGWIACTSSDSTPVTSPSFSQPANPGTEKCTDGGKTWEAKDENGAPWTLTAPAGEVVTEVCVKAGNNVYITNSNGTISVNGTPCFDVTGINTPTVTVTNNAGHVGNICNGISHIQANFGPAPSPSPSPSPSPTPSPSPY